MSDLFSYNTAFCRNLGLVSREDQSRLRNSVVAIAGMGGVGGHHLMNLVRAGVGHFMIADDDAFELVNFNRQYGANIDTIGVSKTDVMCRMAKQVNPKVDIQIYPKISADNVVGFVEDANVVMDGIDAFSIDARQMLHDIAQDLKSPIIGGGPFGFGAAWLTFTPNSPRFADYCGIRPEMSDLEKFVMFLTAACPHAYYLHYLDMSKVKNDEARGPCLGGTCAMASGIVTLEVLKLLLGRGKVLATPHYQLFDVYMNRYVSGKLRFGNRGPLQRILQHLILRKLQSANSISG